MNVNTTICKVCGVTMPVNSLPFHVQGKKHTRLAKMMGQQEAKAARTVFVRGFPANITTQELTRYFERLGEVVRVVIRKEKGIYAFVEFKSSETVSMLLQPGQSHVLCGHRMVIRPKELKPTTYLAQSSRQSAANPPVENTTNMECVLEAIKATESVDGQIMLLMELLALTNEDIEKRKQTVRNIQAVFENRIPGCKVHQYGSSVNGFGVKGCDMDLYLDLNLDPSLVPNTSTTMPYVEPPGVRVDEVGPRLLAALAGATLMQRVNYVFKMLFRSGLRLSEVRKIPASRCPIVQFVDTQRRIHCDLSINSSLSLKNTELLQLICQLDHRVRPLIYTLRYFFKSRELSGGVSGSPKMSSYALCMMAMTYLQQLEPPLLPSIARLAELAEGEEQTTTDGWDSSFSRHVELFNTGEKNGATLEDLLKGFFDFYSKINFDSTVICPREGRLITVQEFLQKQESQPVQNEFKLNVVNIQDPFVLSHNVAQNLNAKTGDLLADELQEAAAKCSSTRFSSPGEDRDWGVTYLVSKERLTKLPTATISKAGAKQKGNAFTFEYAIDIDFKPSVIPRNLFHQSHSVEEVIGEWTRKVCHLLVKTLEELLLFTCEVTTDAVETKEAAEDDQDPLKGKKRSSSESKADEPVDKKVCATNVAHGSNQVTENHETVVKTAESVTNDQIGQLEQDNADHSLGEGSSTKNDRQRETKNKTGESKEKILLEATCSAVYQTWAGRKRVKKELRQKGTPISETFDSELQVTKALKAEFGAGVPHPVLQFDLRVLQKTTDSGRTVLTLQMRPTLAPKMFSNFYEFFKMFFTKLRDNCLFS